MAPFAKRTILYVDTLLDSTGVVSRIRELGLRLYVAHEVIEVADKDKCPHIDTIVVDSLTVVSALGAEVFIFLAEGLSLDQVYSRNTLLSSYLRPACQD